MECSALSGAMISLDRRFREERKRPFFLGRNSASQNSVGHAHEDFPGANFDKGQGDARANALAVIQQSLRGLYNRVGIVQRSRSYGCISPSQIRYWE
jgi:hypothetical protein